MIDASKLDSTKTYVGLEIGQDLISKTIQNLEHKVYKNIPAKKLASHAFAIYNGNVYQAHEKFGGTHKYSIDDYNKDNTKNPILIYEYPLNINRLEYYIIFNSGYSLLQLADDSITRLTGLKTKDAPGVVCSEYINLCFEKFDMNYKMKFETALCTPADLQVFLGGLNG